MHASSMHFEGYSEQLLKLFVSFRTHACFTETLFFNATSNTEIVFPIIPKRNTTENLKEIVKYESEV